jgi:hypothetical protein
MSIIEEKFKIIEEMMKTTTIEEFINVMDSLDEETRDAIIFATIAKIKKEPTVGEFIY